MKLSDIAKALVGRGGRRRRARRRRGSSIPADAEGPGDLALALSKDAVDALAGTRAGAAVVKPGDAGAGDGLPLVVYGGHERMALAVLTRLFDPGPAHAAGVDPTAVVAAGRQGRRGASIGPLAVVGAGSSVGAGTVLLAGATVGAGVVDRPRLHHPFRRAHRRPGEDRRPGHHPRQRRHRLRRLRLHPGPQSRRLAQSAGDAGRASTRSARWSIGDDVEIGAGTTIDRGTLRDTRIGRGTKIDNQVQIAHNVVIGESCIICGMVGIAGSAVIGDRVILAAGVGRRRPRHDRRRRDRHRRLPAVGSGRAAPASSSTASRPCAATLPRNDIMNIGRLKTLYPRVDDLRKRVEALEKDGKGG